MVRGQNSAQFISKNYKYYSLNFLSLQPLLISYLLKDIKSLTFRTLLTDIYESVL